MSYGDERIGGDPPSDPAGLTHTPPSFRSLEDAGVAPAELLKLVIKALQATALETPSQLAEFLRMPPRAVRELLDEAQERQWVHVLGASDLRLSSELRYDLTEKGHDAAAEAMRQNGYVGPAPVSLAAFCAQIVRQKITERAVDRATIDRVMGDMIVPESVIRQLGPAINAGRAILLYGEPGNGKTTLGKKVADLYDDVIYVPYCFEVDGQIVKVFDPQIHQLAEVPVKESDAFDLRRDHGDGRWAACWRPAVVTGGELTLEMLDLSFETESRFYEAPLHIKALGGVFILDDFGRQLVSPESLLNRWTSPLESHIDFLKLHTGKSFALPFDALVIFSTNLSPEKLMDPAFLRRIPYKIGVFAPSQEEYREVFRFICSRERVPLGEEALEAIMQMLAARPWIPLANYQPRFIVEQVRAACKFDGAPMQFRREYVELALDNLGAGLMGREVA